LVAFLVPHFFPHAIGHHLLALIFFTTNRSWFGIFITLARKPQFLKLGMKAARSEAEAESLLLLLTDTTGFSPCVVHFKKLFQVS
jgi:hypothetical protein